MNAGHQMLAEILRKVAPEKMDAAQRERARTALEPRAETRDAAALRSDVSMPVALADALRRSDLRALIDAWRDDPRSFDASVEASARPRMAALSKRDLDALRKALLGWLRNKEQREAFRAAGAHRLPPSVDLVMSLLRLETGLLHQ